MAVTVDITSREPIKAIYSPSHPVSIDRDDEWIAWSEDEPCSQRDVACDTEAEHGHDLTGKHPNGSLSVHTGAEYLENPGSLPRDGIGHRDELYLRHGCVFVELPIAPATHQPPVSAHVWALLPAEVTCAA